jgi:hypothetical protein
MKRLLICVVVTMTCITFFSCKKKKTTEPEEEITSPPPTPVYPTYLALKPGNYWIYELFQVNEDGSSKSLHEFDSSYVEKDTMIRGQNYRKIHKYDFAFQRPVVQYLKDSLHYIVNSNGKILFSSQDFTTEFNVIYQTQKLNPSLPEDTLYRISLKMDDRKETVIVPCGTFDAYDAKTTYKPYPPFDLKMDTRYMHSRYSKDVGLILETQSIYTTVPDFTEKRLVRYKVN